MSDETQVGHTAAVEMWEVDKYGDVVMVVEAVSRRIVFHFTRESFAQQITSTHNAAMARAVTPLCEAEREVVRLAVESLKNCNDIAGFGRIQAAARKVVALMPKPPKFKAIQSQDSWGVCYAGTSIWALSAEHTEATARAIAEILNAEEP